MYLLFDCYGKNIKVINWIYNPEGPLIVYAVVPNKRVDKKFIGVGGSRG